MLRLYGVGCADATPKPRVRCAREMRRRRQLPKGWPLGRAVQGQGERKAAALARAAGGVDGMHGGAAIVGLRSAPKGVRTAYTSCTPSALWAGRTQKEIRSCPSGGGGVQEVIPAARCVRRGDRAWPGGERRLAVDLSTGKMRRLPGTFPGTAVVGFGQLIYMGARLSTDPHAGSRGLPGFVPSDGRPYDHSPCRRDALTGCRERPVCVSAQWLPAAFQ